MFERFTEKAIKVIMLAQEEAHRLGHNFVGAEFIFLGLIGEASGVASQVLRQQGITLKNARIEVEKILGRGSGISPEMNPVDIPFTESAKLVLNSALSFADKLGSESIDTEHLLIGIFQQGESTGIILQNLQVNLKDLTVSLTQYFQQQPSNQLPQTVYVLLYNAGTDNEGIHTISTGDNHTILMFESSADATNFAQQLGKQNFSVPSVEVIEVEKTISFCQKSGYDWEFVPSGTNRTPPDESGVIDQEDFDAFPQDWARTQNSLANAMELQAINAHINQGLNQAAIIGQAYLTDKPIPVSSYSPSLAVDIPSTEVSDSPSLARKKQPTSKNKKNKNIRFIYFLEKLLKKIARSFVVLLSGVFTIVFSVLGLIIFPSFRRKMQSYGIYSKAEYPAEMLELPPIHKPLQSINEGRFIFLKETFLKVCINPNPKLIYPFWEKNLDKFALHEILDVVLQAWMIETLQKVTFYQAYCIALDLANFSQLIQHFPLGCGSENLDTAIIGYKISLRILTFNAYPKDWAYQQYNLGNAYFKREVGDKEENLEEAITCFCAALKVYSRKSFPVEWARTQNNLAFTYLDRIGGDKAENLERAITCYQEALKVYTFDAFPQDWAMTQNNLGIAYKNRITGEKADNLELAIAAYNLSLEV